MIVAVFDHVVPPKSNEKIVSTDFVEVSYEDGRAAMTIELDNDGYPNMFVQLQSWDETTKHDALSQLLGKRVRVTIEIIDESE